MVNAKDKDTFASVSFDNQRCIFVINNPSSILNSLRRSLLNDVKNIAADSVTIRANTSCQTDEYISHRIGMIPFRARSDAELLHGELSVDDKTAWASEILGNVSPLVDIPIMKMARGQSLNLSVCFAEGTGADHVKFSRIGAVAYRVTPKKGQVKFDVMPTMCPNAYLLSAINSLIQRLDDARYFVEAKYDFLASRLDVD